MSEYYPLQIGAIACDRHSTNWDGEIVAIRNIDGCELVILKMFEGDDDGPKYVPFYGRDLKVTKPPTKELDKFITPDRAALQIWESDFPKDHPRRIGLPIRSEPGMCAMDSRRVVMMEDTHVSAKVGDEVTTADGRNATLVTEIDGVGRAFCKLNPSAKFKINDEVEYWIGINDSDRYTGTVQSEPDARGYVRVQSDTGSSCGILQDFLTLVEHKPEPSPSCSPKPQHGFLYFTIGLARSGKSTFCKKWQTEASNRVVLSGDDFRYAVYGQRWIREGEEIVRSSLITAARALFRAGYDVMIDETNTSEASIRHILAISADAKAYFVPTSAETCIDRAHASAHFDLPPSIRRMAKNLKTVLPKIRSGEIPLLKVYTVSPEMEITDFIIR